MLCPILSCSWNMETNWLHIRKYLVKQWLVNNELCNSGGDATSSFFVALDTLITSMQTNPFFLFFTVPLKMIMMIMKNYKSYSWVYTEVTIWTLQQVEDCAFLLQSATKENCICLFGNCCHHILNPSLSLAATNTCLIHEIKVLIQLIRWYKHNKNEAIKFTA